jgi:hypothetical protein
MVREGRRQFRLRGAALPAASRSGFFCCYFMPMEIEAEPAYFVTPSEIKNARDAG